MKFFGINHCTLLHHMSLVIAICALTVSALAQEEAEVDKATTVHATNDAFALAYLNPHLAYSSPHQGLSNCQACHQAGAELRDATKALSGQIVLDNSIAMLTDASNAEHAYFDAYRAPSVQLGGYHLANLGDKVLRGHLKLGDKPVLVVRDTQDENADLKFGDLLLKVDGITVESPVVLYQSLAEKQNQQDVKVEGIRAGEPFSIKVSFQSIAPTKQPFRIGVRVEEPSDAMRSQLSLYENEGIIVTEAIEDSPASHAGIIKHDILLRAGSKRLSSLEDLRSAVQTSGGNEIELTLMRAGEETKVLVTPEREEPAVENAACPAMRQSLQTGYYWDAGAQSTPEQALLYWAQPNPWRQLIDQQILQQAVEGQAQSQSSADSKKQSEDTKDD